jgi:flagellar biosynthesis/type III secretory pathway M-ring protein FliF/YscJ
LLPASGIERRAGDRGRPGRPAVVSPNGDSDLAIRDKMFEFAHRLRKSYANRIRTVTPLVAQARALRKWSQVDMATTESTREQFNPQSQVVRSESTSKRPPEWRRHRRACRAH